MAYTLMLALADLSSSPYRHHYNVTWVSFGTYAEKVAQDMPPQNMSFQYIDYFELEVLEKQQMQRQAFFRSFLST